jgi:hypothetical protein
MFAKTMARQCTNSGEQVSWPLLNRSDDDEPVLCSYSVHSDSSKCVSRRIQSVQRYIQTNLLSLWGSRMPGPGWKLSSHSLWYCISLFYLRWRRRRNYYSCQKM